MQNFQLNASYFRRNSKIVSFGKLYSDIYFSTCSLPCPIDWPVISLGYYLQYEQ